MSEHVYLSTNRYRATLTDSATGALTGGATVTLTLKEGRTNDGANVTIAGVTWPVTLLANGTGIYDWTPPAAAPLVPGRTYLAVMDADLAGVKAHSEVKVTCVLDES